MGVMIETATEWTWLTPHGRQFSAAVRPNTSDWNTINACNGDNDEYRIPAGLSGWALDVGAHIGAATLPLLLDNPDLRVVAIEALPENVEVLRGNLWRAGVAERANVIHAAAGKEGTGPVRIGYGELLDTSRVHEFIGNAAAPDGSREVLLPVITLSGVFGLIEAATIAWAKIDCEGCEYPFLTDPAIGRVERIVGEVHLGAERLRAILEPTHVVTVDKDFGPFEAVLR